MKHKVSSHLLILQKVFSTQHVIQLGSSLKWDVEGAIIFVGSNII